MHIIMEGPDNVGKDTQIRALQTCFARKCQPVHVLHYSAIKGLKKHNVRDYSYFLYQSMFDLMSNYTKTPFNSVPNFIFNRSHIGEYVYSPMYRNYSGSYIFDIEEQYKTQSFWKDLYLILFIDDMDNLIKRDDGLSFSTNYDDKKKEISLFTEAVKKSHIKNKIIININGLTIDNVTDKMISFIEGRKYGN